MLDQCQDFEKIINSNCNFACIKLANKKKTYFYFSPPQYTKHICVHKLYKHKGFVISQFQDEKKITLIPPIQKIDNQSFTELLREQNEKNTSKEDYINQCNFFIEKLKKNEFQKLVLSRIILHKRKNKNVKKLFNEFLKLYPQENIFLYRTVENGMWLGVTPEPIIQFQNNILSTVALAGTQKQNKNSTQYIWKNKEKKEQEYVTKYIQKEFENAKIPYILKKQKNKIAGDLVHLINEFQSLNEVTKNQAIDFLREIHPTPAVCGIPKKRALQLIQNTEIHKRECYTGYIGLIDEFNIELFVNLRCMKIYSKYYQLFVGGGITKDSIPEKEWEETVNKSKTLLKVICKLDEID